jgi:hypothetical protein
LFAKWRSTSTDDGNTNGDSWAPSAALCDPDKSFVIGALAYWEALLAFVVDQPLDSVDYLKPFCDQSQLDLIRSNPWSGISTPLFVYLSQVGILARQKRLSSKMKAMGWSLSIDAVDRDLLNAAWKLERQILDYRVPPQSRTCGTQDPQSSLSHLENYARCYQLASLLELYRSFPELLAPETSAHESCTPLNSTGISDPGLEEGPRPDPGLNRTHRNVIMDLANALMWLIDCAPENCGLSTGYTLASIICGSVLHIVPADSASQNPDQTVIGLLTSMRESGTIIMKWREILRRRVRGVSEMTGLKSFRQVEHLLDTIWSRMDVACDIRSSCSDDPWNIHWLDVMADCKLETVYG